MNFFQEYEQARANPMTITGKEIIESKIITDDDFFVYFPNNDLDDEIPCSIILDDLIDYYALEDIVSMLYRPEYDDLYKELSNACIKYILSSIPEEYHHYYDSLKHIPNDLTCKFLITNMPLYYFFECQRCLIRFNDDKDFCSLLSNIVYYSTSGKYYETKTWDFENKLRSAFKFMCDYRFVPSLF